MVKKKYMIALFIVEIILLIFSLDNLIGVYDKDTTFYHVEAETYVDNYIGENEQKTYKMVVYDSGIKGYSFNINGSSWEDGNILCEIIKDGQPIYSQTVDTLSIWNGKVRLNLEEVRIDKGSYELVLSNLGRGTIAIRIDEYNELNNTQEYSFNYKEFFVCVIIFIHLAALGLFFVVGRIRDGKYSFLVLAVITGLLLVFIIPPYTAPDEMRHFARSYDIASGNIVCASYETKEEYGNQTMPICEFPIELFELKLVSENNGINYTRETNTTIHFDMFLDKMGQRFSGEYVRIPIHGDHTTSSLAFLPQVIMIFLLKLLKVPPCIMFYGARLGNLAAAISLAYAGYNILPQGYRKIYAVLYFAPGICFLRSTSSTDGILYSIVLLFIAIAISLKAEHKSVWKGKVICTLLILACCIGLIKLPYLLIMGLLLLLDRKQFALKGKETFILKLIYVTGMLMAGCILYYITQTSHIKNGFCTLINQYFKS